MNNRGWAIFGIVALLAIAGALYYFLVVIPNKRIAEFNKLTTPQKIAFINWYNAKMHANLTVTTINSKEGSGAIVKYYNEFLEEAKALANEIPVFIL